MYLQHHQTYPGAQGGMIIIQPSGAMTTMPQGYPVTAQQQGYLPHQVNMSSFHKSIGYLGFLLVKCSGLYKSKDCSQWLHNHYQHKWLKLLTYLHQYHHDGSGLKLNRTMYLAIIPKTHIGYELTIIISYPASMSGIIVLFQCFIYICTARCKGCYDPSNTGTFAHMRLV